MLLNLLTEFCVPLLHKFRKLLNTITLSLFDTSHEEIFLNVQGSFMDEFKLYRTIIKVYMHIASKQSVVK